MNTKKLMAGLLLFTASQIDAQIIPTTTITTTVGQDTGQLQGPNVHVGYQAGMSSTSTPNPTGLIIGIPSNNSFVGYQAGRANYNGSNNAFFGFQAGVSNYNADKNVFLGGISGYSNTNGEYNVFTGYAAGYSNLIGNNNVFTGYQAGYNNKMSSNSFYGYQSGYTNANGSNNTFTGYRSGYLNTGSSNVFLGYNAGYNETGSNLLYINNSSATTPLIWGNFSTGYTKLKTRLGINMGTDQPRVTLDVNGKIMIPLASGVDNESAALTMTAADDFLYKTKYINTYGFGFYLDEASVPHTYNSGYWGIDFFTNTEKKMNLNNGGQLLIGLGESNAPTTSGSVNVAAYKLFVKGGILTEEIRVHLASGWADYVFADNYKLRTLYEVEKYIEDNGHLPNVPSAKQVKEDGIELGQISTIQQEKIEELTLYAIEQNKKIDQQQKEIDELKEAVKALISKQ